ncbi:MAG: hypothetical protein GY861_07685 [bacterium]|nr:hypothetical protein [bacterium]
MSIEEDKVALGGSIELSGFKEIDGGSMVVLKKIVGNYAKKFSEVCGKFELLSVNMKKVHEKEKSEKYEIHVKVTDNGSQFNSEVTDMNLFFAVDKALKKVESEISK